MKTYFKTFFAMILTIMAISCQKEQQEKQEQSNIKIEGSAQYDYTAQQCSIPYSIENPKGNSMMSASTDVDWLKELKVNDAAVTFSLEENNTGSDRSCEITLEYPEAMIMRVEVLQTYSSSAIVIEPSSLQTDYVGGDFSFTFTIENPREGAEVTASTTADWITGVAVSDNKVSYTLTENYSASSREGIIELSYAGYNLRFVVSQSLSPFIHEFTVNGVSFNMIEVEGGTFTMGATPEQGTDAEDSEKPAHQVTLSDYYIGQTEVIQELWEAVMGSNPSYFKDSKKPVECVSWNGIVNDFLPKLNSLTGKTFTLPTEAQWEFAARGGNKSQHYKYSGSNNIDDVAWYGDNNNSFGTKPVAQKLPNELGLYDMSGNVWEWCSDWHGNYSAEAQTDPTGPAAGNLHVLRSGYYGNLARNCRVSYRINFDPDGRYNNFGFRLALSL